MANPPLWSKAQANCFFSLLRQTGNVSASARAAKVSRNSAYEKRLVDENFRKSWASALETSLDDLEESLRKRAVDGIDKPIFYGGEKIGDIKSYNDNLGMFLLKARRREVFGDATSEEDKHANVDGETVREKLLNKLDALEN
jgi:hypothetical protein